MVRLATEELTRLQLEQLFSQLDSALGRLDTHSVHLFIGELLGPEEQIMIAKRLAAVILLHEGNSLYKTSQVLKISTSTAQKISAGLKLGKYDETITLLGKNKKNYLAILDTLDNILHLGGLLPRRYGNDRYKYVK